MISYQHYNSVIFLLSLLLLSHTSFTQEYDSCRERFFKGGDSPVCVCDATHCPSILLPSTSATLTPAQAVTYTTSKDGSRLKERTLAVHGPEDESSGTDTRDNINIKNSKSVTVVEVACVSPQQVITGFGGAMTDSSAITINSLSPTTRDALLRSYFSSEGLEYDLVRVPIAGSDFSLRPYTYDDHEGDVELKHFQLTSEDIDHKLPLLHRVMEMSPRPIRVLASPWSAPAWMKKNKKINESGKLLREMWQPWSEYLVKFVKEYEKAGVHVWGLVSQNNAFNYEPIPWNSLSWTPDAMRDWIKESLGPTLHNAGFQDIKLYVGDETRNMIDFYSRKILNDPEAARYVSGLAVHWYKDQSTSPYVLDHAHHLFPDKDILYTESCIVPEGPFHQSVILGSWDRAERYASNIIEDMNHFVSGWIDWNLALDTSGGPNWAENKVDAPIIINTDKDEFYKQPMYYVMGHMSKFVPSGSVAVPSWVRDGPADNLSTAAFIHPHGHVVLQILNTNNEEREVRVEWEGGVFVHSLLPGRSLQTLLLPWEGDATHAKNKYFSPSQH